MLILFVFFMDQEMQAEVTLRTDLDEAVMGLPVSQPHYYLLVMDSFSL